MRLLSLSMQRLQQTLNSGLLISNGLHQGMHPQKLRSYSRWYLCLQIAELDSLKCKIVLISRSIISRGKEDNESKVNSVIEQTECLEDKFLSFLHPKFPWWPRGNLGKRNLQSRKKKRGQLSGKVLMGSWNWTWEIRETGLSSRQNLHSQGQIEVNSEWRLLLLNWTRKKRI